MWDILLVCVCDDLESLMMVFVVCFIFFNWFDLWMIILYLVFSVFCVLFLSDFDKVFMEILFVSKSLLNFIEFLMILCIMCVDCVVVFFVFKVLKWMCVVIVIGKCDSFWKGIKFVCFSFFIV